MVLILSIKDAKNTIKWELDSLNGEPFLKSIKPTVYHLIKLFKKMPGDLLDTLLSVKITVLSLLWNPKSYLMETILLTIAKKLPKELTELYLPLSVKTMSFLKECYSNLTWLLQDLLMLKDPLFHAKKLLLELSPL
jgi:hypothetical protein